MTEKQNTIYNRHLKFETDEKKIGGISEKLLT